MSKKLIAFLLALPASAEIIYATSYNDHTVTSLKLDGSSLTRVSQNLDCGSEPTWLTLDKSKSVLYCLNEGWGGSSSITSYRTSASGTLETLDVLSVLKSPVASTLFANNSKLAVAHYDTSAFTTFSVADPTNLSLLGQQTYQLTAPGTVPERQDAPHLHDAILDPSKKFILVPDLGADLIRVFQVDDGAAAATAVTSIPTIAGSGPRHVAFAKAGRKTFLYSFNELSNTISGYSVTYKRDAAPEFTRLFDVPSGGPGTTVPAGTKAAEIEVSPDQRFVIVSSRGENSLDIPAFDGEGTIKSDPLQVFAVNQQTGALTHVQTAPAGGRNPRGFSLNKAGTKLVSALQDDNRVVVYERDVRTGKLGKVLAHATVGSGPNNGPNYALFDE
ncbi:hypothetical protein QC762_116340 [Podospora pseudocomata]|uniref:6-phosphogluconolactonase n=2 Tax=Podospora TaxID=5144 RepID=A0ABR0GWG7_9PEZI|nr:hypothetical protein QC762_116340 [Podospora pseudocomata]KAK4682434.1 hypothetical protein QC764_116340 [Podospora pseudoanserina]